MNDRDPHAHARHPGFRLHKLEVYNWGTFDGRVHTLQLDGQTALLVGQNGSGKSTLVDALLTLLVRPGVRNYNVAAGAGKQERDERTYVRGAYGRSSRDDDNRAAVQFLRPGQGHYSALLGCFRASADRALTLAVLLHPTADGGIDKIYCLAPEERSLAELCTGLATADRLKQQLENRGFKATAKYTEYHGWFTKALSLRPKAMDVFNQTVAVKDIQSLTRFVRDHMLEAKPWGDKVEELLTHFTQLSEAHQSLVRVRRQAELLEPVAGAGATYRVRAGEFDRAQRRLDALEPFFRRKTVELFTPACAARRRELDGVRARKEILDREIVDNQEERRQLRNEIEHAGGERLRLIPSLIRTSEVEARAKRDASRRYHDALRTAGIADPVTDPPTFVTAHDRLTPLLSELDEARAGQTAERDGIVAALDKVAGALREDEVELASLVGRRGNLPDSIVQVRRLLCEAAGVQESELPFVAELIAVRPEERDWEPTAEKVLRGFALNLLVPDRHYATVGRYIDQTRLADARGRGQRLVYLRVGEPSASGTGPSLHPHSLVRKLQFRDRHPLVPWVRAELARGFDVRCCATFDEFQMAAPPAATRQRHVKWRGRHEKDDRDSATDPKQFVLGWDNAEKRARLAESIRERRDERDELGRRAAALERTATTLRTRQDAARAAQGFTDFSTIDFATHEREADALRRERQQLEEGSDALRALRARLAGADGRAAALTAERDVALRRENDLDRDIATAGRMIAEAGALLRRWDADGTLDRCAAALAELESLPHGEPLAAETLIDRERALKSATEGEVRKLRGELEPLTNELVKLMGKFLRECPEEKTDLEAGVDYLGGFLDLWERVQRDDLVRHERRFKERLNEKVTQEIGLLNGQLSAEQSEIVSRIEQLNLSLRQLEYRIGSHMQLVTRQVRDAEVTEFRHALTDCLSGTFEGTAAADEARFERIEKLIGRLRAEPTWRDRVTDVRRWFDFAAREIDTATGAERDYHADGAGQSGGEKAKLAFTILVAAIAYQYDIDPDRPADRFRFVVIDEMFSKVDDRHADYALRLFAKFGLQLLIVAPLDAKAVVAEPYADRYLQVVKDAVKNRSEVYSVTAREVTAAVTSTGGVTLRPSVLTAPKPR